MDAQQRPIGYWLKRLDWLIDQAFERSTRDYGLTRREWQVLNTLAQAPVGMSDLANGLEPFLHDDPTELTATVDGLVKKGWVVARQQGLIDLTEKGREKFLTAKQGVAQGTRQLLIAGISAEEYRTVIDVLGRMAENLESAAR